MSGIYAHAIDDRARQQTLDELVIEPTSVADLVAFINERLAAGRWVAAGVALIRVKESVWRIFVEEHFPAPGFECVEGLIGRLDPTRRSGLRCSNCGAPFARPHDPKPPTALERAMLAIGESPELSDRAIARRLGLSRATVQRARGVAHGGSFSRAPREPNPEGD